MNLRLTVIVLASYLLFISNSVFAQIRKPDEVYIPSIHTVQLFVRNNQLSYPIIKIGDMYTLELHFDDLNADVKNYSYTFQLCDADWKPSLLSPFDYLNGFTQNRIVQYRVSSGSKVKYVHYQALLPEKNCLPTKTGNYLLKVFLNGDTSQLAFTKRLLIADNRIPIMAQIQPPFDNRLFATHQKVQFSIDKTQLNILNPAQQIKIAVLQNYRWDNAITNIQPSFIRSNIYEYNGERDLLFPSGREYRWLDLRSFRFLSDRIESADREQMPVKIQVAIDTPQTGARYLYFEDLNGFYNISSTDFSNSWWQGDYALVHFTLIPQQNQPFANKKIFIAGQFTNYLLNDSTEMKYNAQKNMYEANLLLKQGYYTYTYLTQSNSSTTLPPTTLDGNYWETENIYTILVYYRSLNNRYDELLGIATLNTRTGREDVLK